MKNVKQLLFIFLMITISAAGYGLYLFYKKPADIRLLSVQYKSTAAKLVAEFNDNEATATQKYLDKIIAVKGNVLDIKLDSSGQATVFLDSGDPMAAVTCSFYNDELHNVRSLQKGVEVTIKGKCTGKLMDVILNKCSFNN